jgi:hypothetical protein
MESDMSICNVIPIIGYAIEEHVITHHLSKLNEIRYYHHPLGDFQTGMTFFHYGCNSVNHFIVKKYINPKIINTHTALCCKSAAIHLLINSKTQTTKFKNENALFENTFMLLDYHVLHGADIILKT